MNAGCRRFLLALLVMLGMTQPLIAASAPEPLVEAARQAVQAQLGVGFDRVELAVTSRPRGDLAHRDGLIYRAHTVAGHFPRARFTVLVDVLYQGRVLRSSPVGFSLSVIARRWVYGEDQPTHAAAEQIKLLPGEVDLAAQADVALLDPAQVSGMRLRRSTRQGGVASLSDFEPLPDVDNRQSVRLKAVVGAITVESHGIALRAGNKGEVVPVEVSGGGDPVRAVIVERGVAQIEP